MATTTESAYLQAESIPAQQSPMLNEVVGIEGGIEDDCKIIFRCNGKHFEILLSIHSPDASIEREYLRRLDGPLKSRDHETAEKIYDELTDLLATLCQPVFRRFAEVGPNKTHLHPTLYHLLYFKVIRLCLQTVRGKAKLHLQEGPHISLPNSFHGNSFNRPCFKPSEIQVLSMLKKDTVFKVYIRGSVMCAKVTRYQSSIRSLQREMTILQRLFQVNATYDLHTPTLLGIILLEDNPDRVIGFLMDYIEPGPSTLDLSSLKIDSIPRTKREAWVKRIQEDLERLHRIGLIWGDAKAGNIILDSTSNPWLIDFGGGFTDGWVDAHLADSIEGDLQGLRRIREFLQCR